MITQQELTDKCTPEIIKKMCEIAEGFDCSKDEDDELIYFNGVSSYVEEIINGSLCGDDCSYLLPLLIHRAVEGWNKLKKGEIISNNQAVVLWLNGKNSPYWSDSYKPTTLTHAECACLHCLLEVFE